ncbi:type II toxin-antitoxin system YafQ family toxin [Sulfurimonas sp.]|uniref:type II toxin-antitoxin system RelE/ParE family toxin n=1 Tax=Sulfurimonas sp. TaxID=2022749 RepID=UPI002B4A071D|nr:type II toxin-antitoxin system YafQ family toxin [Sulfurimonas sp.]
MKLKRHKKFINDLSKVKFSNSQFEKYIKYLGYFLKDIELPTESKNHQLKGEYLGFKEFHLGGDLLVVYYQNADEIILARIGTHSKLFK